MARADRRQAARQARRVEQRPSAASGAAGLAEDTMFFPRIRSHARWVFVLLVIVFGAGFVLLGVGSGTSGLTDVLQGNFGDLFGSSSGSSAQAKKDRERIDKNPKDYAAYKDLASALAADGKTDEAIATLQKLKALNPKDVDGLTQLATLFLSKAQQVQAEGQAIQASSANLISSSDFAPASTTKLGEAYQGLSDPIVTAAQADVNTRLQAVYGKLTAAYSQAVSVYKDVVKLSPNDPSIQFALADAAERAGDTATAIVAYKRLLQLAPDDATAPAIRKRLKQLQTQQTGTSVTAGG
jgi:tetratricopeptide (TPR) repeat protein